MQKINKGKEPHQLTIWKRRNLNGKYEDLIGTGKIITIRQSCLNEQQYLCVYCCDTMDLETSHNEHIKSQARYPRLSLDYDKNIIASCESQKHCGHKKRSKNIGLTPLMSECESELEFKDYVVYGSTERARDTIDILKLNESGLTEKRKIHIDNLIKIYSDKINGIYALKENILRE